jgi:hypothetical protein
MATTHKGHQRTDNLSEYHTDYTRWTIRHCRPALYCIVHAAATGGPQLQGGPQFD